MIQEGKMRTGEMVCGLTAVVHLTAVQMIRGRKKPKR